MSKARDLANAGTALTTVSATELGYLDGVTSAVQTQINSKIGQSTAINPTIVDAKGDIIAASAADTVARLAVGANDTVLTADSSTATGLKWATPAAGGMTLLSTTTLSGSSTTISSISGAYTDLHIYIYGVTQSASQAVYCQPNATAGITDHSYFYRSSGNQSDINANLYIYADPNTNTGGVNASTLKIFNYSSAAARKPFICMGSFLSSNSGARAPQTGGGMINTTSAITSLLFAPNSGTFSGGTVLIYGVK